MTMPQTRHYEMKDSGVEWIGEIPRHWEQSDIGALYTLRNTKVSDKDYPPLSVTMRGILPQLETVAKTNDGDNRKLVMAGDFAINSRSDRRGSCGISSYDGSVSLINTVLTPRGAMHPGFYDWLFHTEQFADEFYKWGHGIVDDLWTTCWSEMKSIIVPTPPLSEQTAIAAYLDKKCATIDAIIAEAKASIEEYKSWKASVIFETVTKGLNPYAEMKDSGVEWIGEIPKGWEVSAVKRHYSITLGKMLESVPQSNDATLENYMCASNVKWGGIDTTTNRQMWFSPIEKEEYLLKEGDLLVMEGGSAGTSAIYRGEYAPCYMQNSVNRCCSKDGSLTHFLYYWMFLVYHSGHVESACNRATIMHLTKEKLGRLPFVYAPKEEQASIVSYLDRKCSLIDGIILEKEDLIRELENYKRSLIFEVVTGKRRVC